MSPDQDLMVSRDNMTLPVTFSNLRSNTRYNCCVEAVYTDSTEDASLCASEFTEGGGKYLSFKPSRERVTLHLLDNN